GGRLRASHERGDERVGAVGGDGLRIARDRLRHAGQRRSSTGGRATGEERPPVLECGAEPAGCPGAGWTRGGRAPRPSLGRGSRRCRQGSPPMAGAGGETQPEPLRIARSPAAEGLVGSMLSTLRSDRRIAALFFWAW